MENFSLDSDIIMQIKHLSKCLKKDFDERLESYGLTGHQGRILFCINKSFEQKRDFHQVDIEECFHLSKSSVSEMVSRMVANDLIKREGTRQCYTLIPTDKGKSIVNEIHESRKEVMEKLFNGFTKEDISNATKYIQIMISNIEKEENDLCGRK